jgi:hypothetical protein
MKPLPKPLWLWEEIYAYQLLRRGVHFYGDLFVKFFLDNGIHRLRHHGPLIMARNSELAGWAFA